MLRTVIILFFFIPIFSFGQFNEKKIYNIKRIQNQLNIDGYMNEIFWQNLEKASNFTQISPNNGENERNNQKTYVKMCYDNKNIYFGIIMYDNSPDSILKELSQRDEENKNFDAVSIYLNPFNDGQIEYSFTVTAAGVQIDKKLSNATDDKTWDAVWKSAVKINKEGWVAEIAIPFSQIRFPKTNSKWALNVSRKIRRYREDYSWNPIDVKYSNYALQAGLIDGISNINSTLRLSFMPYTSIYYEKYKQDVNFPYNYGMDLKYGINESFTLDMTLIPDFGQVSSDARVLNLSPFEVKYDEKRQFFNEGTELFNKGDEMFYSRRIQDDLLNASKITGRLKNGFAVSILNAITNQTDVNPLTNYNISILDQTFGNSSSISIMNTHMVQKGNSKDANVTGIFASINNKKNTRTYDSDLKISQEYNGNTVTKGFAGKVSLSKNNGKIQYNLFASFMDDKYNPNDVGFLNSNNEITQSASINYNQLKQNNLFVSSKSSLNLNRKTLYTDYKFIDFEIELESKITLKNYTSIFASIDINPYEKFDFYEARSGDLLMPVKRSKTIRTRGWISTDYRKKIAIDFGCGIGTNPLYDGYHYHWRISPRYRFNDRISLKYVLSTRNKFNDIGFVTHDTIPNSSEINYIFALRNTNMITNVLTANYIINNKLDFSIKIRYHLDQVENINFKELNNDGYLYSSNFDSKFDINYTTWTSDIAFNWRFAAGSQFSIVWKDAIDNETNFLTNRWIDNINNTFKLDKQNSLSVKLIYYLDYLYLKK